MWFHKDLLQEVNSLIKYIKENRREVKREVLMEEYDRFNSFFKRIIHAFGSLKEDEKNCFYDLRRVKEVSESAKFEEVINQVLREHGKMPLEKPGLLSRLSGRKRRAHYSQMREYDEMRHIIKVLFQEFHSISEKIAKIESKIKECIGGIKDKKLEKRTIILQILGIDVIEILHLLNNLKAVLEEVEGQVNKYKFKIDKMLPKHPEGHVANKWSKLLKEFERLV